MIACKREGGDSSSPLWLQAPTQDRSAMKIVTLAVLLGCMAAGCTSADPVPASVDSELRSTLTRANQAFIRAVRSNDPAQLSPYYAEEMLASLSRSIERAKEAGRYSVSELQDLRWHEVRVRDGKAQVETTERWKHTHRFVATDDCAFVVPARDVRQTYHLERRSGGWVITRVVDDPENEPSKTIPC
jgi:hypothetical protein